MNKNALWAAGRDPTILRRRQPYNELLPATIRWEESLPAELRPLALLKIFPRIANILARAWRDPAEFQISLSDLLVDRRGNRRGFPVEVLQELLTLRDYCQGRYSQLPVPERDVAQGTTSGPNAATSDP